MRTIVAAILVALFVILLAGAAIAQLPPAPGTYIEPHHSDFSGGSYFTNEYIIATYYFYWYDASPGNCGDYWHKCPHIMDPDGTDALTEHPDSWLGPGSVDYSYPPHFSWKDAAWHNQEIVDMNYTGVDVLMPVYWGYPGSGIGQWSNEGLVYLTQTLLAREASQEPSPQIAMFYDTTTLNGVDLCTQAGRDQFYGTIRDHYSLIPPQFWARIDGRVIVWLYSSYWPSNICSQAFTDARVSFQADFGGVDLIFVGDTGWGAADLSYSWGAAINHNFHYDVCAIGPGYDDTAVYGRTPTIRDRLGGAFYTSGWDTATNNSSCRILALETWNEYHEGTEITYTYEFGALYPDLTHTYGIRYKFKESYVSAAYRYLFSRGVDTSGYYTYTNLLYSEDPSYIRDNLLDSPEGHSQSSNEDYITYLYARYLNRAPDPTGFANALAYLNGGGLRATSRDSMLNSSEAAGLISDNDFVVELYRQILGREGSSGEIAGWVSVLQSETRAYVREGFINSDEFKNRQPNTLSLYELENIFDFSGFPAADGCNIDTVWYFDGDTNPSNVCLICDVVRSGSDWSDNDGASCDDSQYCNGADTCSGGACDHAGDPCGDDGLWCNGTEYCDETNDVCASQNAPDCSDDGLWCNGAEYCDEANDVCASQNAPDCDDGVPCTDDSCDEGADQCVNAPMDGNCDDGQWCNGAESCHPTNGCQGGTAPDCNDGVGCTSDSCDEANDQCDNAPDDSVCDDGLFCNGAEYCDSISDCQTPGDPCDPVAEVCDEDDDACYLVGSGLVCVAACLNGYWDGAAFRPGVVDVELYDGSFGLVHSFDGLTLDTSGEACGDFRGAGLTDGSFYVALRHHNHLDLITDSQVSLGTTTVNATIDFTDPAVVACGTGALTWENYNGGQWCMPAGDASGDEVVNIFDYASIGLNWGTNDPASDFSGDGVVNIYDYSLLGQNWNRSACPGVP